MVSFRGQKSLGHAQIGLLLGFSSKFPTSNPSPFIEEYQPSPPPPAPRGDMFNKQSKNQRENIGNIYSRNEKESS